MKVITTKKYILELTEQEANWIKALVQNPIWGDTENEDPQDKIIRKSIWDALSNDEDKKL